LITTTTPTHISDEIKKFCITLVHDDKPYYVDVKPVAGCILNECFQNVENHVTQNGGSRLLGWTIWESKNVYGVKIYCEAEAHAILVSSDGNSVDITPKADNEHHILFLPDSKMKYEGKRIPTKRMSLNDCALVSELLNLYSQADVLTYGDGGRKTIIPVQELRSIGEKLLPLMKQINSKIERNDLCICATGKKYKHCFGK
jgi:hypothetical protein